MTYQYTNDQRNQIDDIANDLHHLGELLLGQVGDETLNDQMEKLDFSNKWPTINWVTHQILTKQEQLKDLLDSHERAVDLERVRAVS